MFYVKKYLINVSVIVFWNDRVSFVCDVVLNFDYVFVNLCGLSSYVGFFGSVIVCKKYFFYWKFVYYCNVFVLF